MKEIADLTDRELLEMILTAQTFIIQKLNRIEHRVENGGEKTDAYNHQHIGQIYDKLDLLHDELPKQVTRLIAKQEIEAEHDKEY